MGLLEGRVAIVTGGSRGLGAASVRNIVANGGRVVIGDVLEAQGKALAEELGEAAVFIPLDVTNLEQWTATVDLAVSHFGKLDVLLNNAGIGSAITSVENVDRGDWNRVLEVNLTGTFNGIQAAVPAMKAAGGGSIINISSMVGIKGVSGLGPYAASKFGVRGLTKVAALDLGRFGIRVNSIHPGNIKTDMSDGIDYPTSHLAIARQGRPSEIGDLVVFLASDMSTYCTAAEFICDGGDCGGLVLG